MKFLTDSYHKISSSEKEIKDFSLIIAAVVVLILGLKNRALLSSNSLLVIVSVFLLLALAALKPSVLAPVQKAWMMLGLVLNTVVNFVILLVIFGGVLTPIGIYLKYISQQKLLESINPEAKSYWNIRKDTRRKPEYYRKQF